MADKGVRAFREVMPVIGRKTKADLCSSIPAVRKKLNSRAIKALQRDDPISGAALANEAAFLKQLQNTCKGRNYRYTRTDDY
jgi:hypothetical protein